MYDKPTTRRLPRVPIDRRAWAFLIDFITVWLITSLVGNNILQLPVFIIAWLGLRVLVVDRNQGQSLGRWALDMKIIDARFPNKIPNLVSLGKREGVLGFAAFLAMIGLNIGLTNALSMLLFVSPLLFDCGAAIADEQLNQAFHDRFAETIIIQSRRGFSLDLRCKKIVAEIKRSMRK